MLRHKIKKRCDDEVTICTKKRENKTQKLCTFQVTREDTLVKKLNEIEGNYAMANENRKHKRCGLGQR
ncbi:CLUMA_CG014127, isoform A [Clunio marinus]|uniref:CLUMA_CG014127, isoform A n=1 Tax=Clunio marinus TaxID=568069 RepID=A0A1J1IMV4_9DIPT|nr:CLUMA_CG014127, isoform A [Clunio marinus]